MAATRFTPQQIDSLKRKAKKIKRDRGCKLHEALDFIAQQHGWPNWSMLYKNRRSADDTVLSWFTSQHNTVRDIIKHPPVSISHVIAKNNPNISANTLRHLQEELESEGFWGNKSFLELLADIAPKERKRRLQSRYRTALIFDVINHNPGDISIVVPAIRIGYDEMHMKRRHPGQLIFRCPVCGTIHFHGAGGMEFGDGNGDRIPHCHNDKSRYRFELEEVIDTKLVGHLTKELLAQVSSPVPIA